MNKVAEAIMLRIGDRVRLSEKGKRVFKDKSAEGTVYGFSTKHGDCIRILKDRCKTPELYGKLFWERICPICDDTGKIEILPDSGTYHLCDECEKYSNEYLTKEKN